MGSWAKLIRVQKRDSWKPCLKIPCGDWRCRGRPEKTQETGQVYGNLTIYIYSKLDYTYLTIYIYSKLDYTVGVWTITRRQEELVLLQVQNRKLSQRTGISKNIYYKNLTATAKYSVTLLFSRLDVLHRPFCFQNSLKGPQTAPCAFIRLVSTSCWESREHAFWIGHLHDFLNLVFKRLPFKLFLSCQCYVWECLLPSWKWDGVCGKWKSLPRM